MLLDDVAEITISTIVGDGSAKFAGKFGKY